MLEYRSKKQVRLCYAVIPVKTGISAKNEAYKKKIPAFAGMTYMRQNACLQFLDLYSSVLIYYIEFKPHQGIDNKTHSHTNAVSERVRL